MKLQEISIDVEKFNAIRNASDEHPERLLGGGSGSPASRHRQTMKITTDQEYVTSMEERYGIREEGIF
jgi:hypothetical protein